MWRQPPHPPLHSRPRPEPTKAPAAAAPAENWWATAAQSAGCVGKTIKGVSESTPPSKFAAEVIAPEFTKETGIKVEFETTSWDQMYDKAIKDMEANTGVYDFVYIEQDIVYAYLARNFLVNITQMLKDKPELAFKDFNVDQFMTFINYFKDRKTGDLYGVPMEAFIKTYLYRKDLFDDPETKAAFEARIRLSAGSGHGPTSSTARSPSSSPSGARTRNWSCGAPPSRPPRAIRPPGTRASPSVPPSSACTTGASTWTTGRPAWRTAAR